MVQLYSYPAEISNTFTHWLLFWRSYIKISSHLDYAAMGTVIATVIFIVIYCIIKNVSKKYADKNTN